MASTGRAFLAWNEWRKHGLLIPVCLLGMTLVALPSYSLGVMFAPLEQEFGWSRSEISGGPFIMALGTLILAPFGGRAVDRYGPRRIAMIGVPSFSLAVGLISLAGPSIYSWWAHFALLSFALVLIYPSVWTAAVVSRFHRNRGLALAVTLSGTGLAAAIFPFVAAKLLEAYGWSGAYLGLALIPLILVFPLVFLFFDKGEPEVPEEDALRPAYLGLEDPPGELLSTKFIRLSAAALIYSVCTTMLGINLVPILMEGGFDLVRAAEIAGMLGLGTIFGRVAGGFLLDLVDGRVVACGSSLGAIGAVAILLWGDDSTMAASLACLSLGLAAGAEYDACAYLCTRHFHPRNFAALFGTIGGLSGFGAGLSPFIANAVYDTTGSYDPVLMGIVPVLAIACVLFLSLGRYPDDKAQAA